MSDAHLKLYYVYVYNTSFFVKFVFIHITYQGGSQLKYTHLEWGRRKFVSTSDTHVLCMYIEAKFKKSDYILRHYIVVIE